VHGVRLSLDRVVKFGRGQVAPPGRRRVRFSRQGTRQGMPTPERRELEILSAFREACGKRLFQGSCRCRTGKGATSPPTWPRQRHFAVTANARDKRVNQSWAGLGVAGQGKRTANHRSDRPRRPWVKTIAQDADDAGGQSPW